MRVPALLAALSAFALLGAAPPPPTAAPPIGPVVGTMDDGVAAFLGVPFSAPPTGARRWAPAAPAAPWTTPRQATQFGPACPQALHTTDSRPWTLEYLSPADRGADEDCLSLNIWTAAPMTGRAPAANRAVIVFIPGGGFNEGSGSVPVYNGAELARLGVVAVTINYRLTGLGFLAHPDLAAANGGASGNWGLYDQIAALQWVKDNIRAFGGDPSTVTVAGQSAGAASIQALLLSPMAKGLFARAILDSAAGANSYMTREAAETAGVASLKILGVISITEARALPADKARTGARAGLVADGRVIPLAGQAAPIASDVPLLLGYNYDESTPRRLTAQAWGAELSRRYGPRAQDAFALYPAADDAGAVKAAEHEAADRKMLGLADWLAARGSKQPAYVYQFTHVEPGPNSAMYGAFHTSELPYVFNSLRLSPNRTFTDLDRAVAARMSAYWANFAKTGNPNGAGLPRWPAYGAEKMIMELGDEAKARPILPPGGAELLKAGAAQ